MLVVITLVIAADGKEKQQKRHIVLLETRSYAIIVANEDT